jgi:hypothetical protein
MRGEEWKAGVRKRYRIAIGEAWGVADGYLDSVFVCMRSRETGFVVLAWQMSARSP